MTRADLPNAITGLRLAMAPLLPWLLSAGHYRAALALAIVAGLSDALARRDAIAFESGEAGPLQVEITGIDSATDFARAMGYLQSMAVVRSGEVLNAGADSLRLQLDLSVGRQGFDRFVASGNTLDAQTVADGDVPRFHLR